MEITDLQSKSELRVCLKQNTQRRRSGEGTRSPYSCGGTPRRTSSRAKRRRSSGRWEQTLLPSSWPSPGCCRVLNRVFPGMRVGAGFLRAASCKGGPGSLEKAGCEQGSVRLGQQSGARLDSSIDPPRVGGRLAGPGLLCSAGISSALSAATQP